MNNITAKVGDGTKGWTEQAPFERIIVTAAATREVPKSLLEQLAPGGIMIAPMGATTRDQHLYKIQQDAVGEIETKKLWLFVSCRLLVMKKYNLTFESPR